MDHDQYQTDRHYREAVRKLSAEFAGRLSRGVVASTVLDARRDLQGQITPEAMAEMLHRLAHHRLGTLVGEAASR
ncbi:hypothetical protein [Saccharothrix sp. HUAS TT1]|uniref:hypothetical protein n=1 Tax=unclassified Saccharothrix TaxID=2593673 RepID=UPI00345B5CC7